MTDDPQVRALEELLRAGHEAWIAEVQKWADAAGATGDVHRHLEHVERLKAMPYLWEQPHAA